MLGGFLQSAYSCKGTNQTDPQTILRRHPGFGFDSDIILGDHIVPHWNMPFLPKT